MRGITGKLPDAIRGFIQTCKHHVMRTENWVQFVAYVIRHKRFVQGVDVGLITVSDEVCYLRAACSYLLNKIKYAQQ